MSRTSAVRMYGRKTGGRTKPLLFQTQLPISPTDRKLRQKPPSDDPIDDLTEQLTLTTLEPLDPPDDDRTLDDPDGSPRAAPSDVPGPSRTIAQGPAPADDECVLLAASGAVAAVSATLSVPDTADTPDTFDMSGSLGTADASSLDDSALVDSCLEDSIESGLRVLAWADMCPPGDRIEKIAEASYAEVYRVSNARGTSIIKAIRLASPIKSQTKLQVRSGLVDEEPHDEEDLRGELAISEWLADIPGFVVYKERYIVRGRAPKALLETHQAFHRRAKRHDPGRLQFYPSPSRYLDDTRFLVIELGDAGQSLEDAALTSASQLWDVFLHVAIALARAEDLIRFEHRDLHEGNLCIRQVAQPRNPPDDDSPAVFGYSGLDITILDYGLSRAGNDNDEDDNDDDYEDNDPIAFDLEKDLSLFTSTHAEQCRVYRQMRSYLLTGDRVHLPPERHQTPYEVGPDGVPISWKCYRPYTNVLWLAYLYGYLVRHFAGDKADLARFRRATRELWKHMNPDAPHAVLSFPSATDIVRFAVEAGWLTEDQLLEGCGVGCDESILSRHGRSSIGAFDTSLLCSGGGSGSGSGSGSGNDSIIEAHIAAPDESAPRRSPRRRRPVVRYG